MATKLFVGSLPYAVDDAQLEELFASFGVVISAKVIFDRDTNRSKGFGFVEMEDDDAAQAAVKELDGKEFGGRSIVVNVARPQERRERSFGGGSGGGGGGGGYRNDDRGGRRY